MLIPWATSGLLGFKGTRETRNGLEQDDMVALKLPSGEQSQV